MVCIKTEPSHRQITLSTSISILVIILILVASSSIGIIYGGSYTRKKPIHLQSQHNPDDDSFLLRQAFRSYFNISSNTAVEEHHHYQDRNATLGEEQIATLLHCDSLNPTTASHIVSSPRCQRMMIQSMMPNTTTTTKNNNKNSRTEEFSSLETENAWHSLEQFYAAVKSPGWACQLQHGGEAFQCPPPSQWREKGKEQTDVIMIDSHKIGIAMVAGGEVNPVAQAASIKNKQDYATRHGYGIHIYKQEQSTLKNTRAMAWVKVVHILSILSDYEYVWSIDLDTIILDMTTRLETSLIDPRFDLVMGVDMNGLNSGSFIIKNSPWSRLFLHMLWLQDDVPPLGWWEQSGIHKLFGANQHFMSNHLKRIPQDAFNMYEGQFVEELKRNYDDAQHVQIIPFVIHFAGDGQKWNKVIQYTRIMNESQSLQ